ncbi:11996_t:CDS:2 [Gigaspora rosea]|nr:11996_t:CDS:2 [Gigaspora rosea]
MPRPNAKSSIASNKARNSDSTFAKVINNIKEDTSEDWKLFEITHNTLQDYVLKAIEWHEKADKKLKPTFYTRNSRTNLWKKRKAQEQLQHEAKRMQTLDEMWNLET